MHEVDFAVITPLPEEWQAVKTHLDEPSEPPSSFPTIVGRIGRYRVVVRMPLQVGGYSAADVVADTVAEWQPRWIVLVGIAGGFTEAGVSTGDVVVASKIYPYEYGKIRDGTFERRDAFDVSPDPAWLARAKLEIAAPSADGTAWTKRIKRSRPDRRGKQRSKLHYGPVASGEKVVDDPGYRFFADAKAKLPDLYAIEMEGAGAGTAVEHARARHLVGFFMIRGISDVPREEAEQAEEPRGTEQRDAWKDYAAAAAAAFLEHLLTRPGSPLSIEEEANYREQQQNTESPTSAQGQRARSRGLPDQATSFIGRQHDVVAAVDLLRSPSTRLLSLVGTPGVGKTRLAIQVAQAVQDDFADGIVFADLASLDGFSLVPSTILQSLGLRETGSRPVEDLLKELLGEQEILLVLDNFEHVVPAAPLVSAVLQSCPGTKVLVTSRRPLHLSWEREFLVDPMDISEAVALFEERARARRGDFSVTDENRQDVTELCERLDGIPLAIELAAARVKSLPPSAILERLERRLDLLVDGPVDVSPRHLSLRAALDWSHDLLSLEEQALFRRLSVFHSDFSLNAAAFVGTLGKVSDWNSPEALKGIGSLIENNLIRRSSDNQGPRYVMLQSVREYAHEHLARAAEIGDANFYLATYIADAIDVGARNVDTAETARIHEFLDVERDNVRAAVTAAARDSHVSLLLRLTRGSWRYWLAKGYLTEGRGLVDTALRHKDQIAPEHQHEFLAAAASFARDQGDFERAATLTEECLTVVPGDHARAEALRNLGLIQLAQGRRLDGEATLREALDLHRKLGRADLAAYDLISLGTAAADGRDFRQSLDYLAQADQLLQSATRAGVEPDPLMLSAMVSAKARAWHGAKNIVAAAALYEVSLSMERSSGHKQGMAYALQGLAQTAFELARHDEAIALVDISVDTWRELGDRRGTEYALKDHAHFTSFENVEEHRQQVERWLVLVVDGVVAMPEAHSVAVWAESLAGLIATRLPQVAARLLGAATEIRESTDAAVPDESRPFRERLWDVVRDALTDEEAFRRLTDEGRRLSADELKRFARLIASI